MGKFLQLQTAIFIAVFFSALSLYGQTSSCVNADFEMNSFLNWTGTTGYCCPIVSTMPGIVTGRQTIMTGNGKDPNTNDTLAVVAPGGLFSARLGNDETGSEAEQLKYSFTVSNSTALFIYRYAVVLEDPSHTIAEQPRFQIKVYDQNGDTTKCGTYFVYSTAGIPGFRTLINQFGSTIHWKDWTTIGIDLSSYVGQTITIEFSTGDCALGGHYGYAYVDCYCSSLSIKSDYCPGAVIANMVAPPGFASYKWSTGATTPSITITNPVVGTTYSVTMISVTGCPVTLNQTITRTVMASSFNVSDSCQNSVSFKDSSQVIVGSPITSWFWNFGDGATSTLKDPVHNYAGPGNYNVSLVAVNSSGCRDTFQGQVRTLPLPTSNFKYTKVCPWANAQFTDISTSPSTINSWLWNFGDSTASTTSQNPVHTFPDDKNYNVSLTVKDIRGCTDTGKINVTMLPTPVADFSTQAVCGNPTVSFKDSSVLSSGTLTGWSWDFGDGSAVSTQHNPSHVYAVPGNYPITFSATASSGCSDTINKPLNVMEPPKIGFSSLGTCENTPVRFTDSSVMLGNVITNWLWDFGDNSAKSSQQNPQHTYSTAGNYTVSLTITASNGCTNVLTKPMIILPSPTAAFKSSVTCPGFATTFTDQSTVAVGSINSWSWDFGDGFAVSSLHNPSYTYSSSGTYFVYLFVTSINGCRDSISIPVTSSAIPVASFTITPGCTGTPLQTQNQSTISAGTIASYSWNFGDGTPLDTTVKPAHVYVNPGVFDIVLTTKSDKGCVNTKLQDITIPTPPVATFAASTSCSAVPVSFSDLTQNVPATIVAWKWNFGDGQTSVSQNPIHLFSAAGNYNVTLEVTNSSTCRDSVSQPLLINETKITNLQQTICNDTTVTVGSQVFDTSGIYSVVLNTSLGCDSTVNLILIVNPVHSAKIVDTICDGEVFKVGTNEFGRTGIYNAVIQTTLGCDSIVDLDLTVNPIPQVNAIVDKPLVKYEVEVQLDVTNTTPQLSYNWTSANELHDLTDRNPIGVIRQSAWFFVIAKNEYNCTQTDSVFVELYDECYATHVYVPDAFTPNNDGVNDCFSITYAPKNSDFKMEVFDRWGDKVFETHDPAGCWDGTSKGKNAMVDNYPYWISFKCYNGSIITKKGIVALLR